MSADQIARAEQMRKVTLPGYRHRIDPEEYILLCADADVAMLSAEIGNAKTTDRLLDRLRKRLTKLDEEAAA